MMSPEIGLGDDLEALIWFGFLFEFLFGFILIALMAFSNIFLAQK